MEFTTALDNLIKLEGSGFSGIDGGTNTGITQAAYSDYRAMCGLPDQTVAYATPLEIQDIYYRNYWIPLKCGQLPDGIDFAVFQAGVNQGVGTASKMLQQVVSVNADGHIGQATLSAVDTYIKIYGSDALASAYFAAQQAKYQQIVAANPAKGEYLDGWLNRISSTYSMISDSLSSVVTAAAETVKQNPGGTLTAMLAGTLVFFSS